MRTRYFWDKDLEAWVSGANSHARPEATFAVIRDEIESTVNMANGQRYTSKAKFRRATRAHGCVEVGTSSFDGVKPPTLHGRREVGEAIKRAMEEARSR